MLWLHYIYYGNEVVFAPVSTVTHLYSHTIEVGSCAPRSEITFYGHISVRFFHMYLRQCYPKYSSDYLP